MDRAEVLHAPEYNIELTWKNITSENEFAHAPRYNIELRWNKYISSENEFVLP